MSRIACVIGAVALFAAPALAASSTNVKQTVLTASYRVTLEVGPLETMYTQAQVNAKHPKSGEVMLGDSMSGMDGMKMVAGNRHLEIHVASRATGKVLAQPPSSLTLTDMNGMMMTEKISPVEMEGIGEGTADLHYGNNVKLTAGHVYKVDVTVKGEKASFTFHA